MGASAFRLSPAMTTNELSIRDLELVSKITAEKDGDVTVCLHNVPIDFIRRLTCMASLHIYTSKRQYEEAFSALKASGGDWETENSNSNWVEGEMRQVRHFESICKALFWNEKIDQRQVTAGDYLSWIEFNKADRPSIPRKAKATDPNEPMVSAAKAYLIMREVIDYVSHTTSRLNGIAVGNHHNEAAGALEFLDKTTEMLAQVRGMLVDAIIPAQKALYAAGWEYPKSEPITLLEGEDIIDGIIRVAIEEARQLDETEAP